MTPHTGWSNALLAGLAVLAVGTSAYAVWSVNQPPASTAPGPTGVAVPTATGDDAGSTSAPATAAGADSETSTASGGTEQTGEGASVVADWVEAWAQPDADLLVIGDGYSNLPSQWVQQWGALVGQERPVTIRHWGEAADVSFNDPIELSSGQGDALEIWSASRGGTTIADATERLETFDAASHDPEAVLVSLGQASAGEDIPVALDDLLAGLPEVPVLVLVGPAGLYEPGVGDAVAEWAGENADRVVTVDLREATSDDPTAEEWALAFQDALES